MNLLTRSEEYVLLSVWKLQQDAYTLNIRERLSDITETEWSLGSVYTPLERLCRRRMLTSVLSDSTPERGGRKKRIYSLTPTGRAALVTIRRVEMAMWTDVRSLVKES